MIFQKFTKFDDFGPKSMAPLQLMKMTKYFRIFFSKKCMVFEKVENGWRLTQIHRLSLMKLQTMMKKIEGFHRNLHAVSEPYFMHVRLLFNVGRNKIIPHGSAKIKFIL